MSKFSPTVSPHLSSVIDNLRSQIPKLKNVAAWRIDMAHRNWSVSEDFGDDEAFLLWLPKDTNENKFEYMNIQLSDQKRTIMELEKFNLTVQKTVLELRAQIEKL